VNNEQSVRLRIEQMIADRDNAFCQGNTHGIFGHFVPYDRHREQEKYRLWTIAMDWTEDRISESLITQFEFDGSRAFVVVEQNRHICFRNPLPVYTLISRLLLGLLSKFVIIEREMKRSEWVTSSEGWKCYSEERLTYRTRSRLRGRLTNATRPAV